MSARKMMATLLNALNGSFKSKLNIYYYYYYYPKTKSFASFWPIILCWTHRIKFVWDLLVHTPDDTDHTLRSEFFRLKTIKVTTSSCHTCKAKELTTKPYKRINANHYSWKLLDLDEPNICNFRPNPPCSAQN